MKDEDRMNRIDELEAARGRLIAGLDEKPEPEPEKPKK